MEGCQCGCRALGAEQDGFVTYGKFRNFLILLPEAKLREADPSIAWFEAATMVPVGELCINPTNFGYSHVEHHHCKKNISAKSGLPWQHQQR